MPNLEGCWSIPASEHNTGWGNVRGCCGCAHGTGCCLWSLGGAFFRPGRQRCAWCVSCDRQMYDNINKWLRGSGGSWVLVEGESCASSFDKVLCPTCCQAPAGEYSLLMNSKELCLPPLLVMCCKSSSFPKQKHGKGNAEILQLFPRGGKQGLAVECGCLSFFPFPSSADHCYVVKPRWVLSLALPEGEQEQNQVLQLEGADVLYTHDLKTEKQKCLSLLLWNDFFPLTENRSDFPPHLPGICYLSSPFFFHLFLPP